MPILPVINEGGLLILSRDEWGGWYFLEEFKNVQDFGYKIEVVESYIFDKGYGVFDNFVIGFYKRKKKSIKIERLLRII